MSIDHWLQQTDSPLYPDILWSRPESKHGAGKLTIIGGNSHGFGAPGSAYTIALQSGAGVCRVLIPDAVKKVVSGILPDADFAPSTPSGSFSKQSLQPMTDIAMWGDSCILAGDIGRNSETAIVLEQFVKKYRGLLTLTQDSVDYFKETPLEIVDRPDTLIALSLSQLQKIFIATPTMTPITLSMTTQQLVSALHDYTQVHTACIITKHNDLLFIACDGKVATQKLSDKIWRVATATRSSVFWMQNPTQPFEACCSALFKLQDT